MNRPTDTGGLFSAARDRGARLLWALRINAPDTHRPRPKVEIALRPSVPGWLLRLLGVLSGASCLLVLSPPPVLLVVGCAALVGWLIRPGGVAFAGLVVVVAVGLVSGVDLFHPAGYVATAALHLLLVLSGLLGATGWSTCFDLAVLQTMLRRWLLIQLPVQLVGLLARLLATARLELPLVQVLAGIGVVALAAWLVTRLSR